MRSKVVVPLLAAIAALFVFGVSKPLWAADDEPLGGKLQFRESKPLPVKKDDGSAERAIAGFHVAPGLKVKLFAAEPMLSNPNALSVDEHGRVYVSEANRFKAGVIDVRSTMNWLEEDIAARTVADRVAMVKKHGTEKAGREAIESTDPERIVRIEDSDGDGKADKYSVFSEGYNRIEDGLASGVMAYKGNVYATIIPNLYLLKDTDGDGKADTRKVLSTGYGVRYAYLGHDLHGLVVGPDGRLYFSVGDRGATAEAIDGSNVTAPETGSVFRCDLDGKSLELFATGLRNPQELRFDDHGNLFTGDNNPDKGDPARWVYVLEGGDSGWRIGYQHAEKPKDGGPWTSEQIFQVEANNNANYIVPHVAHAGAGPSGLAYYTGVGLPEKYKGAFFMCDYRGQAVTSGIWAFKVKPKGAGFELTSVDGKPIDRNTKIQDASIFYGTGVVDCEQGPDGSLYVADWTSGWDRPFRGRVYRVVDESREKSLLVLETKKLLAEGFEKRSDDELVKLLSHADQRVRQEAQFALVAKGAATVKTLSAVATAAGGEFSRFHAIWGLGQIGRGSEEQAKVIAPLLLPLLEDKELEVRCQAAKVLAELKHAPAYTPFTKLAADPEPRARYFAAMALGKLGNADAVPTLVKMLAENADKDGFLRYGVVWALASIKEEAPVAALASHQSPSVRLGAALALRRMESPEVARFLGDSDRIVVLEAARAIHDLPIVAALPRLAELADQPLNTKKGFAEKPGGTGPGPHGNPAEWILWRAVNAGFREGTPDAAKRLAKFAARTDVHSDIRAEALRDLAEWGKPGNRDRITNLFRPIPDRDAAPAREAAKTVVEQLANDKSNSVKVAAAKLMQKYGLGDPATLARTAQDAGAPPEVRLAALGTLVEQKDARVAELLKALTQDKAEQVRESAIRIDVSQQAGGVERARKVLGGNAPFGDKQAALDGLGDSADPAAVALLADQFGLLASGALPKEAELELIEAAAKKRDEKLDAAALKHMASRKAGDPVAESAETLVGGDAALGRRTFFENAAVSCVRCHMVNNEGGVVGPALDGIAAKHPRTYLLEAIVNPNAAVAPGYESAVIQTKDGRYKTGVVRKDDDKEVVLVTADNETIVVQKADIRNRERGPSPMPEGLHKVLPRRELRDLVEYLATLKEPAKGTSLDHGAKK